MERTAGGVVYRNERVLLLLDRFARWTFPKGHLEEGEAAEQAALREITEETGIVGAIEEPLGVVTYPLPGRSGGRVKEVRFYLVRATGGVLSPQQSEIKAVEWLPVEEAHRRLKEHGYRNLDAIWEQARARIERRLAAKEVKPLE